MKQCRVVDSSIPNVIHIADELDVCVTLITGSRAALLVDTGYGLGGLRAFAETLTDKPITVINSHAHWDHALGNWMFPSVRMHPDDFSMYEELRGSDMRAGIAERAKRENALPLGFDPEAYMNAPLPDAVPETGGAIDLGGLSVHVLPMPGHTRGSLVFHVPELGVIIMGDNWNPTVWMFFPCSVPLSTYRAALRGALALPFERMFTSHGEHAYPRETFEAYVAGMTDELIRSAPKDVDTPYHNAYDTRRCYPLPGMPLVFDGQRITDSTGVPA